MERTDPRYSPWAELCLGLIVAAGAWAIGAVQPTAFSSQQLALALLALLVFWRAGTISATRPIAVLIAFFLLIPALQLVPLPATLVAFLSPARATLGQSFQPALGSQPGAIPLSVNPYATEIALTKFISYAIAFLLGLHFTKRSGGRPVLPYILIAIGVLEAGYGLIQWLTGMSGSGGAARGTYINPDDYAGLLEMILPFLFAQIVLGGHRRETGWKRALALSDTSLLLQLVAFLLIFLGVTFSLSRMGIVAAITGLLAVAAIAAFGEGHRLKTGIPVIVVGVAAMYAVWIGIDPIVARFQNAPKEVDRVLIWQDTLRLIRDYPLLGTGAGTYPWSSFHYQTHFFGFSYEHAHNDYLEFAADFGIPYALIWFAAFWLLAVRVASRRFRHSYQRVLAAGCAGSLIAILVHGVTDFNLQIPANALVFVWIAGVAAGLLALPRKGVTLEMAHTSDRFVMRQTIVYPDARR